MSDISNAFDKIVKKLLHLDEKIDRIEKIPSKTVFIPKVSYFDNQLIIETENKTEKYQIGPFLIEGPIGKTGLNGSNGQTPTLFIENNILYQNLNDNVTELLNLESIRGKDGELGQDGYDGIDGKNGLDGETGPQGIQGKDGIQGIQGITGQTGKSAYEIAILNGFSGTEKDFLNSLKGEKGLKGDKGDIGPKGLDGKNGQNGADGQPGIQGIPGKDGLDGLNGCDGKDGLNGINGKNGLDGQPGIPGKDGVDGTNGKNGVDGKNFDESLFKKFTKEYEILKKNIDSRLSKIAFGAGGGGSDFTGGNLNKYLGIKTITTAITANDLIIDCKKGNTFKINMNQNITSISFINWPPIEVSQRITLYITQAAPGNFTISGWPTGVKWSQGMIPILTGTENSVDCLIFDSFDSGTTIYGNLAGLNYQ